MYLVVVVVGWVVGGLRVVVVVGGAAAAASCRPCGWGTGGGRREVVIWEFFISFIFAQLYNFRFLGLLTSPATSMAYKVVIQMAVFLKNLTLH